MECPAWSLPASIPNQPSRLPPEKRTPLWWRHVGCWQALLRHANRLGSVCWRDRAHVFDEPARSKLVLFIPVRHGRICCFRPAMSSRRRFRRLRLRASSPMLALSKPCELLTGLWPSVEVEGDAVLDVMRRQ